MLFGSNLFQAGISFHEEKMFFDGFLFTTLTTFQFNIRKVSYLESDVEYFVEFKFSLQVFMALS